MTGKILEFNQNLLPNPRIQDQVQVRAILNEQPTKQSKCSNDQPCLQNLKTMTTSETNNNQNNQTNPHLHHKPGVPLRRDEARMIRHLFR